MTSPPPTREGYWSALTFPLLEISVSSWFQFFLQMMAPGFKPSIFIDSNTISWARVGMDIIW